MLSCGGTPINCTLGRWRKENGLSLLSQRENNVGVGLAQWVKVREQAWQSKANSRIHMVGEQGSLGVVVFKQARELSCLWQGTGAVVDMSRPPGHRATS